MMVIELPFVQILFILLFHKPSSQERFYLRRTLHEVSLRLETLGVSTPELPKLHLSTTKQVSEEVRAKTSQRAKVRFANSNAGYFLQKNPPSKQNPMFCGQGSTFSGGSSCRTSLIEYVPKWIHNFNSRVRYHLEMLGWTKSNIDLCVTENWHDQPLFDFRLHPTSL